ncbi:hypothetical protein [Parapedobacter soli]|uniref:hypothetical protein n=1 Tax=Parapedobacter soli TaxID=416955 RepID=UPI0021C8B935|nr:hypothetical protein [Parapedobacter soli]
MTVLKHISVRQWVVLALFNLLLVAALGLLMRLKVLLPLPSINQKFLLHAHSHFAFSGWVSHALMVLVVAMVFNRKQHDSLPWKYQLTIIGNLLASYGMLIGFFLQGYGLYSIIASSAGVVISYIFAAMCWRDLSKSNSSPLARRWLRAALVFLVLSSIGTFYLAHLMTSNNMDSRLQLAAVYFYLHFQYNGWFFFACMALLYHWLHQKDIIINHSKTIFWLFAITCLVNYLLSVLWWDMPIWLYIGLVAAVIAQSIAWGLWLRSCTANLLQLKHLLVAVAKWLLLGVAIAATIKFILQGLSVIPSLSQLSYSFRPIVIGYLHLVLLAVISLFVIAYGYMHGCLRINRLARWSTTVLVIGVILNELLLMTQGISGLARTPINHIPLLLAAAAGILLLGIMGIFLSQRKRHF